MPIKKFFASGTAGSSSAEELAHVTAGTGWRSEVRRNGGHVGNLCKRLVDWVLRGFAGHPARAIPM
jgi:hypothetical protein